MICPPTPGLLDGMSRPQLQAALEAAQAAYVQMMSGQQGVTFSYAQGDGTKMVTNRPTSPEQVTFLIRQLQQALGVAGVRRRPLRMIYR
jgi:hypothetical protein